MVYCYLIPLEQKFIKTGVNSACSPVNIQQTKGRSSIDHFMYDNHSRKRQNVKTEKGKYLVNGYLIKDFVAI